MFKTKVIVPSALGLAGLSGAIVFPSTWASPQNDTVQAVAETQSQEPEKTPKEETTPPREVKGTVKDSPSQIREPGALERLNLDRFRITETPDPVIEEEVADQTTTQDQEAQDSQPVFNAPVSDYAGDVVAAALSRVGAPYVWGSTGPDSFDCSGLVYWAFQQVGKTVPRVSDAQIWGGTSVSLDDLQPGDVVGYSGGGHVGIYIGDGQMVHAPTTGDVVKVVPVDSMPRVGASRY